MMPVSLGSRNSISHLETATSFPAAVSSVLASNESVAKNGR